MYALERERVKKEQKQTVESGSRLFAEQNIHQPLNKRTESLPKRKTKNVKTPPNFPSPPGNPTRVPLPLPGEVALLRVVLAHVVVMLERLNITEAVVAEQQRVLRKARIRLALD